MGGIGETLKNAREEKGISLEQVEQVTKIRSRYLDALESEDYNVIPGKVYVKGFLKNYADYLGLDADELIMQYKSSISSQSEERASTRNKEREKTRPQSSRKFVRKKSNPKWRKYAFTTIIALAAIATLLLFNNYWKGNTTPADDNKITIDEPNNNQDNVASNDEVSQKPQDNEPPQNQPNPGTDGQPVNNEIQETPTEQKNYEGVNIVLNIKDQDCWVKVIIDGQTNYTGTMVPGETKTFDGKEKVRLILGNAGAAEVTFNGKNLGFSGEKSKIVKIEYYKNGDIKNLS